MLGNFKKKEPKQWKDVKKMLYYCYEIGHINDCDNLPEWLRNWIFPLPPPIEYGSDVPDFFK